MFYVGNLVGETGDRRSNDPNALQVTWLDYVATRRALGTRPASPASLADHNRDGVVDRLDLAAVRGNMGTALSFVTPRLASPPATGGIAAALSQAPRSVLCEENDGRVELLRQLE